jgi:hypothetical protein
MPDGVAPRRSPWQGVKRRCARWSAGSNQSNQRARRVRFRELEERYKNLAERLDGITSAHDLEDLISKLRAEETRYEAVFGAVAANFHSTSVAQSRGRDAAPCRR